MDYKVNPHKLLVEAVIETETKTASGIYIPPTINQKKSSIKALVLLSGKGSADIEMIHQPGDVVLHNPYQGNEFEWNGKTVKLIDQADVLLNLGKI